MSKLHTKLKHGNFCTVFSNSSENVPVVKYIIIWELMEPSFKKSICIFVWLRVQTIVIVIPGFFWRIFQKHRRKNNSTRRFWILINILNFNQLDVKNIGARKHIVFKFNVGRLISLFWTLLVGVGWSKPLGEFCVTCVCLFCSSGLLLFFLL